MALGDQRFVGKSRRDAYQEQQDGLSQMLMKSGSEDKENDLKKFMQAQEPEIAGKKQAAQNSANLETLNDPRLQEQVNKGGSAKVGDLSVGADPYAHIIGKQQQLGSQAISAALRNYNSQVPKLQNVMNAANEGIQAISDPKQIGSLGQARTLALKGYGMNRYNEQEAKAVLPPAVQGMVAGLFNSGGGDETPLSDSQRRSMASLFQAQAAAAKQSHDQLKNNSLNMYKLHPGFDAARGQQLESTLGKPFEDQYNQFSERTKGLANTQTPPEQRPEPVGMIDKLRSFLSPAAAGQAAPQQGAPMSFEEFKAKKSRGEI